MPPPSWRGLACDRVVCAVHLAGKKPPISAICLRPCYAMSGTDLAYDANARATLLPSAYSRAT
eukprot:2965547-Rhodomonas_salina.2